MIVLSNILPEDLKKTLHSYEYDEEGGLSVRSIIYLENEVHFNFSLYLGSIEQNETHHWQLQVKNCCDSKIDLDNLGGYFDFYSDHYLLWEFVDYETELYFKKPTENPEKLLADIYTLHRFAFDNLIPIERFLNGNDLLALCNSPYGKFARGPKRILDYYFKSLEKAGKEPYFLGEYFPTLWDGEKRVPESRELKVALLGGTYFIGEDFIFKRLDK